MSALTRPDKSEYPEYYGKYMEKAPEGDILEALSRQMGEVKALLETIGEARGDYRYAPGKWSVKEVVGHLIDTERVFAYRALRFGRGDPTPLPGFDQDEYVARAGFATRALSDLAAELEAVRAASLTLFRSWDEAAAAGGGTANQIRISARSIPYILAGHERHHLSVLKERYLGQQETSEA